MPNNTLSIQSVGPLTLQSGDKHINTIVSTTATVGSIIDSLLASGDNVIICPTGATAMVIVPPVANVINIKLKGAVADTGVHLHDNQPSVISLDPTQTSIILNLASTPTSNFEITFI